MLKFQFSACKRKLDSKCEALLILSQELDQCRSERDQFKLMAEQLRERYQSLKKQMSGKVGLSGSDKQTYRQYCGTQGENVGKLLYESREVVKSQQFEVDDLKQKLSDAQGDIKLLREQIARQRVGTTDEGMNTRHFPAHEREDLVKQLEASREQYLQLERDLQTVLDEKQEFVTERDAYKTKYDRLNQELNYILRGDEKRIVDIDALVMENKYLQERLKQMEEEKTMAMAAVSKYKSLLEKRKTKSCIKLGQSRGGGMVITQKEVHQVLETQGHLMPTPQAMADLQALAGALLDSVNDKNLALSHQRKTNKILGSRVAELEKKLKTLEVSGLWNVPATISASLEKLKSECEEVKTMVPDRQNSETSDLSASTEADHGSDLETVSPLDSTLVSPEPSPTHGPVSRLYDTGGSHGGLGHLELEDLDLLPTKEISSKSVHFDMQEPAYSIIHQNDFHLQKDDLNSHNLVSKDSIPSAEKNIINIPAYLEHLEKDIHPHTADTLDVHDFIDGHEYRNENIETGNETSIKLEEQANYSIPLQNEAKIFKDNINQADDNPLTEEDINGTDTDEQGVDVTVYNADKVTDTDDSEVDQELQDNFLSENNAEIDTFYNDKPSKLIDTEDTDNENDEQSERVGLLMENATQKMRNISQRLSGSDDESHIRANDIVDEGSCSDVLPANDTESQTCPLMQDQEQYEPDPDDLRNVEC